MQVRWRHHGREQTRSFRTLTEAVRFKKKLDAGDTQPTSKQPFKTYALEWVETYTGRTARGLSDSTRESYRDALNRYAIPYFKTTPLERIDPPALRRYIAHLSDKDWRPGRSDASTPRCGLCWRPRSRMVSRR